MKTVCWILLTAIFALPASASTLLLEVEEVAADLKAEPVNTSTLKLLGRGLAPRRNRDRESLAIGCYREDEKGNCTQVRFVYFSNPQEAFFIGHLIHMPVAPNEELKTKALQVVLDNYFLNHQTARSELKINRHITRSFILLVVAGTVVALSLPTNPAGGVVGAWKVFATLLGTYFITTNVNVQNRLVSGTLVEAKFTDENGWSWADRPKKISRSNFDTILGQIHKGRKITYGHYNKETRIDRRMMNLQDEGVRFEYEQWDH